MNNGCCGSRKISIVSIPEISAVYFALLQCGYDCFSAGRSREHCGRIRSFLGAGPVLPFFSGVRQDTCKVYPYWPRAALLETASFYLNPGGSSFRDFDAFRERVLSAGNLAENERGQAFWDWVAGFPAALSAVLASAPFRRYLDWEDRWIAGQNAVYEKELHLLQRCLDACVSRYASPVREAFILLNPIKSVYSADYHWNGGCFLCSSGAFQAEAVVHEFLHPVVHPAVIEAADLVLANRRTYPELDPSYCLSGDETGQLNAFEEYAVRKLTQAVLRMDYPENLPDYLKNLM